jgi:hypothetical protein
MRGLDPRIHLFWKQVARLERSESQVRQDNMQIIFLLLLWRKAIKQIGCFVIVPLTQSFPSVKAGVPDMSESFMPLKMSPATVGHVHGLYKRTTVRAAIPIGLSLPFRPLWMKYPSRTNKNGASIFRAPLVRSTLYPGHPVTPPQRRSLARFRKYI